METLGKIRDRGDTDFTVNDFDSMPYLLAFGKVRAGPIYLLTRADHLLCIGNLENLPGRN